MRGAYIGTMSKMISDEEAWAAFERRDRAIELAAKLGRHPIHIALAYVLAQPFPVIPLIGPRNLTELEDSLSALSLALTPEQVKWLEEGKGGKAKSKAA